jgi:hypothetical protein
LFTGGKDFKINTYNGTTYELEGSFELLSTPRAIDFCNGKLSVGTRNANIWIVDPSGENR